MDGVLGYHLNPLTCGVAKFNLLLARRLGIPVRSVFDPAAAEFRAPLLSLKLEEFAEGDPLALDRLLDRAPWGRAYRVFLHAWSGTEIERRMLQEAAVVYCGNAELVATLRGVRGDLVEAWAPSTLGDVQRFGRAELSVFSFGMAHKIRADHYRRLHALLEETGLTYGLYLSTALHETTSFDGSFTVIFEELQEIFGKHIYFLGYLSDTAVYNYLAGTTFFAAFFEQGVRANNTSVNAAMQTGSVVITNLDEHSPKAFVHGENLLDIGQCSILPTGESDLAQLSARARVTATGVLGWDALVATVRTHEGGEGEGGPR